MHHVAPRNNEKSISLTRAIRFTSTWERVLDILETSMGVVRETRRQTIGYDKLPISEVGTKSKEMHYSNSSFWIVFHWSSNKQQLSTSYLLRKANINYIINWHIFYLNDNS